MRHGLVTNVIARLLAAGSLVFSAGTWVVAAPASTRAEGTIASVGGSSVVITTGSGGHIQINASPDTHIISRRPAQLTDIGPGQFVAVTAKKETNGMLSAVSINILPSSLRGKIREGQWPMETGDIMTNAVITRDVARVSGHMLYLTYKDGTAMINVPMMATVHRMTLITIGDLKPGMHASAYGTQNAGGSIAASFIIADASGD